MVIRKAEKADIPQIMEIVNEARAYFAENGIPQWQGEYPSEEYFARVIDEERLYCACDGEVLGVYAYDNRPEKDYEEIYEGSFRLDQPYAAIHTVAVSGKAKGRGIAGMMTDHASALAAEQGFRYMRGDTHRLNISMQRMFEKNGFQRRGIIYLGGDRSFENERFAFDKILL